MAVIRRKGCGAGSEPNRVTVHCDLRNDELTLIFARIMDHMAKKHPDVACWGDTTISTLDGRVISQECFICGEELVTEEGGA